MANKNIIHKQQLTCKKKKKALLKFLNDFFHLSSVNIAIQFLHWYFTESSSVFCLQNMKYVNQVTTPGT